MKANVRAGLSPFAHALRRLIDDSKIFDRRADWAMVLDVSEAAISQWVNDKTIPQPELLQMILRTVEESEEVPQEIVVGFHEIARQPADQVSPHGHRMGPTLEHYLLRPVRQAFDEIIAALEPPLQRVILHHAMTLSRQVFLLRMNDGQGDEITDVLAALESFLASLANRPPEKQRNILLGLASIAGGDTPDANTASDAAVTPRTSNVGVQRPTHSVWCWSSADTELLLRSELRRGSSRVVPFRREPQDFSNLELLRQVNPEWGGAPSSACEVAWWRLESGKSSFGSLPLNELLLYVHRGTLRFHWDGSDKVVTVGDVEKDSRLLWMPGGSSGLPPFNVEVEGNAPPLVLAVFFARSGVRLDAAEMQPDSGECVTLHQNHWSDTDVQKYWGSLNDSLRSIPVLGRIPRQDEKLADLFEMDPVESLQAKSAHYYAQDEGQLKYGSVGWSRRLSSHAQLDVRLIRFPKLPEDFDPGNLWMASHAGFEVMVPLSGAFTCVTAELSPAQQGEVMEIRAGDVSQVWHDRVSSDSIGDSAPEVLLLQSELAHGFFASRECNSHVLLIRTGSNQVRGSGGAFLGTGDKENTDGGSDVERASVSNESRRRA